jgi:hypothetical protein
MDKFVEFDIDIEMVSQYNFKITNIPIFNRVWIERPDKCLCLFSVGHAIDTDVNNTLVLELHYVKSMRNFQKPIDFEFIDTSAFNEAHAIGGNLHCLIKNKY